jgi:hypothetical protein
MKKHVEGKHSKGKIILMFTWKLPFSRKEKKYIARSEEGGVREETKHRRDVQRMRN